MSWFGPHPFKTFEANIDAFCALINLPENPNQCWEWNGWRNSKGYGAFYVERSQQMAHRLSWRMIFGEIPNGQCACHKCDNPGCVNPFHLFLDTKQGNNLDKMRKNRQARNYGESNGSAKLTPSLAKDIIDIRKIDGLSYKKIGNRFNVSAQAAWNVVNGVTWVQDL